MKEFDWLDELTLHKYLDWVEETKRQAEPGGRRLFFTKPSKTDGLSPIKISEYKEWAYRNKIGRTDMVKLPEGINPYDGIDILYKKENTNPSGSGKDRSASFMLYYYKELGFLDGKDELGTSSSGNFGLALLECSRFAQLKSPEKIAGDKKIVAYMGTPAIERNPDFISYFKKRGGIIRECDDTQCPSVPTADNEPMQGGGAIMEALKEEFLFRETKSICFEQHGAWKRFDAALNSAAYYYTLAPEIIEQVKEFGDVHIEFCQGVGTGGSFSGTSRWLLEKNPCINSFSYIPIPDRKNPKETIQLGLRTKEQRGETYIIKSIDKLCKTVYEAPDKKVAQTFITLLENGIPACLSFAANVYICLERAKELDGNGIEAKIITVNFNSLQYYWAILEKTFPRLGIKPGKYAELFEDVVEIEKKEKNNRKIRK